jgi:hypothetical protein
MLTLFWRDCEMDPCLVMAGGLTIGLTFSTGGLGAASDRERRGARCFGLSEWIGSVSKRPNMRGQLPKARCGEVSEGLPDGAHPSSSSRDHSGPQQTSTGDSQVLDRTGERRLTEWLQSFREDAR